MSKNLIWAIVMMILLVVVFVVVFIGPGTFAPKGQFTRDEYTQLVGQPAAVARAIPQIAGAGGNMAVFLNVDLGTADGYAIVENVPDGFDVFDKGDFSLVTNAQGQKQLRYQITSGATGSPSHRYILTVPDDVNGSVAFLGIYVFGNSTSNQEWVNETSIIVGIKIVDFPNATLNVTLNLDKNIFINNQQSGARSINLSIVPGTYIVGFENITDHILMKPLAVTVKSGQLAKVACNYTLRDPADTDADGMIRPLEINIGIGWFLNNQLDSFGEEYTISKLAKSISRFFKFTYFSTARDCSITIS